MGVQYIQWSHDLLLEGRCYLIVGTLKRRNIIVDLQITVSNSFVIYLTWCLTFLLTARYVNIQILMQTCLDFKRSAFYIGYDIKYFLYQPPSTKSFVFVFLFLHIILCDVSKSIKEINSNCLNDFCRSLAKFLSIAQRFPACTTQKGNNWA